LIVVNRINPIKNEDQAISVFNENASPFPEKTLTKKINDVRERKRVQLPMKKIMPSPGVSSVLMSEKPENSVGAQMR
jgi:hypothetical protein